MNAVIRISEAAGRLSVSPNYLRLLEWERRIPEVGYDRAGRFYTEADIELLRAIGVGTRPRRLKTVEEVSGAAR